MSIEQLKAFLIQVGNDPALQLRFNSAASVGEEALSRLGQSFGYNFSEDDVLQLKNTIDFKELDDEDLDPVSGGGNKNGQYESYKSPDRNPDADKTGS